MRAALSAHLAATRGLVAHPGRIIVTIGAQEALALAARVLLAEGGVAVPVEPCFAGAAGAFEAAGADLARVAVDADGIRTDALPAGPASVLYLTPAHHYPTGCLLAPQRRPAATAWARRTGCVIITDLNKEEGRAAVEDFYQRLVPSLDERPTLVRSRAGHFMDKPDNVISLINLATLRSLEERWGHSLEKLRFRANFYIDGARPWEEFDWIGSRLQAGDAVFRVDRRNGRCGATNVDPWTGRRDRDLPTALRAAFGHKDLGVYLVTEQSGTVGVGDRIAPDISDLAPAAAAAPATAAPGGPSRLICRGCYFVCDEAAGWPAGNVPPGTPVTALPAGWRCPDCGTDPGKLRPHSGGA